MLGGVYGLERVANSSTTDRTAITRIMGAYVRSHSPWPGAPGGQQHPTAAVDESVPLLISRAPIVQAVMEVLSRRKGSPEKPQLYLARADLRSLLLNNGRLPSTLLRHSNLARAWMPSANLNRCDLTDADLRRANLREAHLVAAILLDAHLQNADLAGANLRRAIMRNANLCGTNFRGARLARADFEGAHYDTETIWPDHFNPDERGAVRRIASDAAGN